MSEKLLLPSYRARWSFLAERLVRWYGASPAARILDLGCGEGDVDSLLADYAERVDACDIHEGDVGGARRRNAGRENVFYSVEDALSTSYPSASFDLVVCLEVIEHVDDPLRLLAEIYRILRPGGKAVITCPSDDFPSSYDPINRCLRRFGRTLPIGAYAYGHTWLVREAEFRGWAEDEGFAVVEQARLSKALAGLLECYLPGAMQKLLKPNAANRAGVASRRPGLPERRKLPPGLAVTDALVRLDERLFAASRRSIGLAFVLEKTENGS